jgi:hypothetical protein
MIVNYTPSGWEIITQRAHGLLAAQIANYWKEADRPARWVETLLAIGEHDDAELEFYGVTVLNEAGGPLDFSMRAFDAAHCRRTCQQSRSKSRLITLLHSMHLDFLYRKMAKTNQEARAFLSAQVRIRARLRRELKLSVADAGHIYSLLQWCDALALLLCQRAIQPEGRAIEIGKGAGGQRFELWHCDTDFLTVSPWPFGHERFTVRIESRNLRQLAFRDPADFRRQLDKARVEESVYSFRQAEEVRNLPDR